MKTKEWAARRPQHLVARIVCLLLAVVTWLCVMRISDPVCNGVLNGIAISVVDNESVDWTCEAQEVTGRIRICGTKAALAAVKAEDVSAYVDMADLQFVSSPQPDEYYTMTLYFKTPDGIVIDGEYTIRVCLKAKA